MKDVTDVLQSYRECMRHLWNVSFLNQLPAAQDRWNLRDLFDDAGSVLFNALVVDRLVPGVDTCSAHALSPSRTPSPPALTWLHVVPVSDRTPIMINRDAAADSGYWDHGPKRVSPDNVDLRLERIS